MFQTCRRQFINVQSVKSPHLKSPSVHHVHPKIPIFVASIRCFIQESHGILKFSHVCGVKIGFYEDPKFWMTWDSLENPHGSKVPAFLQALCQLRPQRRSARRGLGVRVAQGLHQGGPEGKWTGKIHHQWVFQKGFLD